ncbi:MAG: hypothetical protein QOJ54_1050 [Aliidongia sp.]|jgi:uncharacterized alpha-E superfamily protein|nr:hypothetical protein [Aliidongia sp.]
MAMLSRVADNLYWMARYLERAAQSARLLGVNLNLMIERSSESAPGHWQRVLEALWLAGSAEAVGLDEPALRDLVFARDRYTSIFGCVAAARHNARQVREEISADTWECINRLYLKMRGTEPERIGVTQLFDFLHSVVEALNLVRGTMDGTMSHGEGWRFIQVGQYIERAMAAARLLDVYLVPADKAEGGEPPARNFLDWVGLLNSCTAFEPYCKIYARGIEARGILEFLLLNAEFPHSIRYCIDRLQNNLGDIAVAAGERTGRSQRLAGRLQAQLNFGFVDDIMSGDLSVYLRGIEEQCLKIHDAVYHSYILYSLDDALIA